MESGYKPEADRLEAQALPLCHASRNPEIARNWPKSGRLAKVSESQICRFCGFKKKLTWVQETRENLEHSQSAKSYLKPHFSPKFMTDPFSGRWLSNFLFKKIKLSSTIRQKHIFEEKTILKIAASAWVTWDQMTSEENKVALNFFNWAIPGLCFIFLSSLDCNWQRIMFKDFIPNVGIRTAGLWCRKRLLCQLRHNHGPRWVLTSLVN